MNQVIEDIKNTDIALSMGNKVLEEENKVLTKKVEDIEIEKEQIKHELENFKDKLNSTERYLKETENYNHTNIGIWMNRESEIKKMMHGECPYCEINFKKMSTMINHYNIKHGGSCPYN